MICYFYILDIYFPSHSTGLILLDKVHKWKGVIASNPKRIEYAITFSTSDYVGVGICWKP